MTTTIPSEIRKDILERRIDMGQSVDEIAKEYEYLTVSEINNVIADVEQQ